MSDGCPIFCQLCMYKDADSRRRCCLCARSMCDDCAVGVFMCNDCHATIARQGVMPGCRWCTISTLGLETCVECKSDVCEVCREFYSMCMRYYCAHHECIHSE